MGKVDRAASFSRPRVPKGVIGPAVCAAAAPHSEGAGHAANDAALLRSCRPRTSYAFEDMGEQSVKNIARPVRAYRVAMEPLAEAAKEPAPLPLPPNGWGTAHPAVCYSRAVGHFEEPPPWGARVRRSTGKASDHCRRRADRMERRAFIVMTLAALGWPLAGHAQQTATPVIGYLSGGSPDSSAPFAMAFRDGLRESGYVEGRNVAIEYRWQEGRYDRAPALAAELVGRRVTLIVASGGPASAFSAKAATTTIPIVFVSGTDPVKSGLVASLNRPGGNITGVTFFAAELATKRLELLHELVPDASEILVLVNPSNPNAKPQLRDLQAEAQILNQQLVVLEAASNREIGSVFATLAERQIGALLVTADGFFSVGRTNSSLWRPVMRCPRCIP